MSRVLVAVFGLVLMLWAYSPPGERLGKDLAALEQEVRSVVAVNDEAQWQALMERRDALAAELERTRPEMTESQIQACNETLGAISGHEMKHALNSLGDGIKDAVQQAQGMLKAFQQDTAGDSADTTP